MRGISFPIRVRSEFVLLSGGIIGALLLPMFTQAQPRFQAPVTASYSTTPYGIAHGDFNGDGKMDVVIGGVGTSTTNVTLLLNDGKGGFLPALSVATGTNPQTVAVGDFDGDGKRDLLTANYTDNNVSFLKGNGDGTFAAPKNFAVGINPQHIVVGDFNGDGALDFATANFASAANSVTVWLGSGAGGFDSRNDYSVGSNPRYIAVGDLDNDGAADLVTANNGSSSISVLMNKNDGTGAFFNTVNFPVGATARTVALGDLDGDGDLDLVVTNGFSNIGVLRGDGTGNFGTITNTTVASIPVDAAIADFNGDGKLDVAVVGSFSTVVSVLRGNGDGTFQPRRDYPTGNSPVSLFAADVSGDGKPDFVTANQSGLSITYYTGNGDGTFVTAPLTTGVTARPASIATGDFNGDGKLDVVTAGSTSNDIRVSLGGGNGTFSVQIPFLVGTGPSGVAVADFNGDGKLDVAVSNQILPLSGLGVLFGNGDGTFQLQVLYPSGPTLLDFTSPLALVTGDFNGDGFPDIALVNNTTEYVTIYLNDGSGFFTTSFTSPTLPGVGTSIAVGDINHDGKADLIVGTQASTSVSIFPGNGDGTFGDAIVTSIAPNPFGVAVGDVDGDGNPDVLVAGYSTGVISVLLGIGDGTFQPPVDYFVGTNPAAVIVRDFDGDGKLDVASVNSASSSVTVLQGNGDGTFAYTASYVTGLAPRSFAAGDFNGDGREDLIVANYSPGTLTTLLNIPSLRTVSGVLTFAGLNGGAAAQNVRFEFRPASGAPFTRTAAVPASGVFTLANIPPGVYTLWIKGDKYLAQVISGVNTTNGSVTGIISTQFPGDASNDNRVDVSDFGLFVNAFGDIYAIQDPNAPASDVAADFNGDGIIDVGDFGLLVNSFGNNGDL